MNALFDTTFESLDLMKDFSPTLTSTVNDILEGTVSSSKKLVLDLCKVMLLGDTSLKEGKALAHIVKVKEDSGRVNAAVRVVKVVEELDGVMRYRQTIYNNLGKLNVEAVDILKKCCQCMVLHPGYTESSYVDISRGSSCDERIPLTYAKKEYIEPSATRKRKMTTTDMVPSPKFQQPIDEWMCSSPSREDAQLLLNVSSPIISASPYVHVICSPMSSVTNVSPINTADRVTKAARKLELYFP